MPTNRRQIKLRQAQEFPKFREDIKMVALVTIKMGSNMWMEVINSENPPMKPVDIRISNDIYWALASALEDGHKYELLVNFVILPKMEMVMDIQHGMLLLYQWRQKSGKSSWLKLSVNNSIK